MNEFQGLELMAQDVTPEFLESLKPSQPLPEKRKCHCHCQCKEHQPKRVTPRRVTFPEEEKIKRVPTPNGGERIIRRRKRKSYDQLNFLLEIYNKNPEWTKEVMQEVADKTGLSEA